MPKTIRYDYNTRGKCMKGKLSDSNYNALKIYLQQYLPDKKLKDTIVIKYDFNNADCWHASNEDEDSIVLKSVHHYQRFVNLKVSERPGITVLEFREKGNQISKYRKLNDFVKVDSGFLQQLFFYEKVTCGTSVIILPDQQFLLLKSDPHFDALFIFSEKESLDTLLFPKIKSKQ